MSGPRLRQIRVLSDEDYELVFDDNGTELTVVCTVAADGPVPLVRSKPDLFSVGRLGDPRPITAAVLAVHRARQP